METERERVREKEMGWRKRRNARNSYTHAIKWRCTKATRRKKSTHSHNIIQMTLMMLSHKWKVTTITATHKNRMWKRQINKLYPDIEDLKRLIVYVCVWLVCMPCIHIRWTNVPRVSAARARAEIRLWKLFVIIRAWLGNRIGPYKW